MRTDRRWRSRAIATLAIVVLGANCTNDDEPDSDERPSATSAEQSIRLGLPGALVVDPVVASVAEPAQLMTVDLLFDGLTDLDADGVAVPALAEGWTSDAAHRTWAFVLDPDRTFSDGSAIVAADVVGSLERLIRGGDTSLAALRLEGLSGFRAFVDGSAPAVAGLRAVDETTIELAFDAPLPTLPVLLSGPSYGIVDPSGSVGVEAPQALNLSGDWDTELAIDGALTLHRREGSDGDLEAIDLVPHADAAAAYAAFEEGLVDWAEVPDGQVGDAIAAYGDAAFSPFHAELLLGFNLGSPTFAENQELRAAIASAIDREAIVRAVYPDLAIPLERVVPSGVPGRADVSCTVCSYEPAEARTRLAAAFPGGAPTVHIDFDESPAQEALARLVADDLADVGITAELRPQPLADYQQFVVSGGHELFSFGWVAAYGSPDAYLSPLFGSGSDDNLVGFASEEFDALVGAARTAVDVEAAGPVWAEAEALVLESAVVVPIAQFRTQVVVADRVEGLRHDVDGTVDWSDVSAP